MMTAGDWTGEIRILCASPGSALRLRRVLGPESSREVPRTRVELFEPIGPELRIRIECRDTGALRAALQTFLGWVQLESETSTVRGPTEPSHSP